MDLNFYSDLSDGSRQPVDADFLETQPFNGYESIDKFPGSGDTYMTITGNSHPFLSSTTFHTPSLGDEEFEIPPISLDPDSALTVEDVEAHFDELAESSRGGGAQVGTSVLTQSAVVGGTDPSFASTYVTSSSQGLEHLGLGVMNQSGGSALLSATLGVDLGQSMDSHFSSASPMPIDVPLGDIGDGVLGHNQLTTIDHSELSAQLGLGLSGGGGVLLARTKSPEQPLSVSDSPAGSLQDDDMDDFRQSVLIDPPATITSAPLVVSHMPSLVGTSQTFLAAPSVVRRVQGKTASMVGVDSGTPQPAKPTKPAKDPNEPQKPVSAYALFFRDTQAAIKGQNPNATFGEVSKIVASMWDSLGEEQKQVYKRKTDAAKKEYLKALAAYRANLLSKPEGMNAPASPQASSSIVTVVPPAAPARPVRLAHTPEQNTITNICASNIILDSAQMTTRSRTGSLPPTLAATTTTIPIASGAPAPTVTKIIISKQMLQGLQAQGTQIHQIPTSMVTVIPAGVRALQPAAATITATRQPPPLQQMQHTPPPPRLQQMVHTSVLPPLQAKPRIVAAASSAAPPPLQIKIVPATLQTDLTAPVIVTTATGLNQAAGLTTAMALSVQASATAATPTTTKLAPVEDPSEQMEVELNVSPVAAEGPPPNLCVRAGCTNPAVESRDWDKEYCSNECVASHCRDIFMAWCSIKSQNSTAVK